MFVRVIAWVTVLFGKLLVYVRNKFKLILIKRGHEAPNIINLL